MSFSFFNAQSLCNSRQGIYKCIYKCTTYTSGISYTILKQKPKGLLFFNFVNMRVQSCLTLCDPHGLQSARLLCPWDFPGKNTGAGCHILLQGSTPPRDRTLYLLHLLHWQNGSLPVETPGSFFNFKIYKLKQSSWNQRAINA